MTSRIYTKKMYSGTATVLHFDNGIGRELIFTLGPGILTTEFIADGDDNHNKRGYFIGLNDQDLEELILMLQLVKQEKDIRREAWLAARS